MRPCLWTISLALFGTLTLISVLGEARIPRFGADDETMGRFMKALYTALGGIAFALLQPGIRYHGALHLQRIIRKGGSTSSMAGRILAPAFVPAVYRVAHLLGIAFGVAAIALARHLWRGGP